MTSIIYLYIDIFKLTIDWKENSNMFDIHEMQDLLRHIDTMGQLLVTYTIELIDSERLKLDKDEVSEPLHSMANIIQEKAKAGLKIAEKIEAHLFELKHKHIQNDA